MTSRALQKSLSFLGARTLIGGKSESMSEDTDGFIDNYFF